MISRIETGSLAEELELVAGDKILKINGRTPLDIIDLSFLMAEEEIELLIEHADGEREIIAFEKDIDEELGAEFESAVFDGIRRCKNHCVFCFVYDRAEYAANAQYQGRRLSAVVFVRELHHADELDGERFSADKKISPVTAVCVDSRNESRPSRENAKDAARSKNKFATRRTGTGGRRISYASSFMQGFK